jgi:large subunit ribosomal protein L15
MRITDVRLPQLATARSKRVGRGIGSGRGKTAGRGTKGYFSRSGSSKCPGFEGGAMTLIRRLPKRGFTNRFRQEWSIVNVRDLERFDVSIPLSVSMLRTAGLVAQVGPVKVLGSGELTKAVHVQAHLFSQSAADKITQAGGQAEIVVR